MTTHIKYTLIFLILFTKIIYSQLWNFQETPVTKWLLKCDFTDTLHGWAVGEEGTIIATTNGGLNWTAQVSNTTDFIYSVAFLNNNTGWAISNQVFPPPTKILRTTNGGNNWSVEVYPDSNAIINDIYIQDSLNIWMEGFMGYVLRSTDGGFNWARMEQDTNMFAFYPIRNMKMYSKQFGFCSGGHYDYGGIVWRTTNYGQLWTAIQIGSEPIFGLHYFDSLHIIGVGGDFEYGATKIESFDGGLRWDYIPLNFFGIAYTIQFRTPKEVWCPLGFSQRFLVSLDTCKTWNEIMIPDSSGMYDMEFIDSLHGWTVGANGKVMRYNKDLIGINNDKKIIANSVVLNQNYPNPFNPYTYISFYLPKPKIAEIIIYDINGREVDELKLGFLSAGDKKFRYDASKLASGVYIYKLITDNYSEAKKMVIIK